MAVPTVEGQLSKSSAVAVAVDLAKVDARIDEVQTSQSAPVELLASVGIRTYFSGVFVGVLIIGERRDEGIHEIVDGNLVDRLCVAVAVGQQIIVGVFQSIEGNDLAVFLG